MDVSMETPTSAESFSSPPVVWKYSDYRIYLNDYVSWKKSDNAKFSYGYFAKVLGTTKSYLKLVVSQQRNISLDMIIKISTLLKHTHFERQYFLFLYLENYSEDTEMKVYFRAMLNNFVIDGAPRNPVIELQDEKKYAAMRDWVMLSISGLAACKSYEHQADWIHRQLGGDVIVSKRQVREAMDDLVKRGVIEQDGTIWKLNVESQFRSANAFDMDQHQMYKTGLTRALLAVDSLGRTTVHDPKMFHMNIIAVNLEDQKKVMALYEEFSKKLWDITNASSNPERVMLLSNNIIALNGNSEQPWSTP